MKIKIDIQRENEKKLFARIGHHLLHVKKK